MSSKDSLKRLTSKWYNKLKKEGFEDIEWYNHDSGAGQNTPYLKDSALNYKARYNEFTETHFRLMQNYCTNCPSLTSKQQLILQYYCNGDTYRQILKQLKAKGRPYYYKFKKGKWVVGISLFSLHKILKQLILDSYEWNKSDPEGLTYEGTDSAFQSDPYFEYIDEEVDAAE